MNEISIVSCGRTAIGSMMGSLSSLSSVDLGADVVKSILQKSKFSADNVDQVIMGQVLSSGAGQAPARQVAIKANLPVKTSCVTVNKVCGSGLQSIVYGCESIALGKSNTVVAGGMESMSNTPYAMPGARKGFRLGDSKIVDLILRDGLLNPYDNQHMGFFGEKCAQHFDFTRQLQDDFAKRSYEKAIDAQKNNYFSSEIIDVEIIHKKSQITVNEDEEPKRYMPEKMSKLKPVFLQNGTITAANASKINDGAAAVMLMNREEAKRQNQQICCNIKGWATHAADPQWFSTAPIAAIDKVLKQLHLSVNDIDLFEINEAFAVVPMAAIKELNIDESKVNIFGGAIALGHPIGCSGTRIVVTLINAMKQRNSKLGCAALCIGGGEAIAIVLER